MAAKNNEAARLWISGLEAVNRKLGAARVVDLSATPFFLRGSGYAEGTLVRHATYGVGRVVELSGHGAMRKVKIRFSTGERTFIADKVTLEVVRKA